MRREYSIEFRQRVIDFYNENVISYPKLAKYFNIPYSVGYGIISNHKNKKPLSKRKYGPSPTITYEMSDGEIYSAGKLMKKIGCCKHTALKRMHRIRGGKINEAQFFKLAYC